MIQVIVGNQSMRKTELVSPETTLRTVLENAGIDYAHGATHLYGSPHYRFSESPLEDADLDKSFSDFGIIAGRRCYLLNNKTKGDF